MFKLYNCQCSCGHLFEELMSENDCEAMCPICGGRGEKQPFSFSPTVENNVHWKEVLQKGRLLLQKYKGEIPYSKNRFSQSD